MLLGLGTMHCGTEDSDEVQTAAIGGELSVSYSGASWIEEGDPPPYSDSRGWVPCFFSLVEVMEVSLVEVSSALWKPCGSLQPCGRIMGAVVC